MFKKFRKSLYKFIFRSFLKLVYVYKINSVYVCFFKSNKYIKKRRLRRLYLRKKHKRTKRRILKKIKRLFLLKFFKNIKLKVIFSNNFSHSGKFLKLKKKKS